MNVEIVNQSVKHYANIGRHFFAELRCGKQHMTLVIGQNGIQAVVHNASNRAWKGIGRSYASFEKAREHYKSAEVRAMLDTAERLNTEADKPAMDARMVAVQNAGQNGSAWEC